MASSAATLATHGYRCIMDGTRPKCVGKGHFGKALLVSNDLDQLFVAKVINLKQLPPHDRSLVREEVELMQGLTHPFVIRFVESFMEGEKFLFIVMEYADAGTINKRLKKNQRTQKPIPLKQVMGWFVQLCLALEYLHGRRLLHRDIKPDNIFLTKCSVVKLGDFGVSKRLQSDSHALTMVGTPQYYSPELCEGDPYTGKADVWALGVVLYELTCLAKPFGGTSMVEMMSNIINEPFTPPPPRVPSEVVELLGLLLEKEERDRPNAAQLLTHPYVRQFVPEHLDVWLSQGSEVERYPLASVVLSRGGDVDDDDDDGEGEAGPAAALQARIREEKAARDEAVGTLRLPPVSLATAVGAAGDGEETPVGVADLQPATVREYHTVMAQVGHLQHPSPSGARGATPEMSEEFDPLQYSMVFEEYDGMGDGDEERPERPRSVAESLAAYSPQHITERVGPATLKAAREVIEAAPVVDQSSFQTSEDSCRYDDEGFPELGVSRVQQSLTCLLGQDRSHLAPMVARVCLQDIQRDLKHSKTGPVGL